MLLSVAVGLCKYKLKSSESLFSLKFLATKANSFSLKNSVMFHIFKIFDVPKYQTNKLIENELFRIFLSFHFCENFIQGEYPRSISVRDNNIRLKIFLP